MGIDFEALILVCTGYVKEKQYAKALDSFKELKKIAIQQYKQKEISIEDYQNILRIVSNQITVTLHCINIEYAIDNEKYDDIFYKYEELMRTIENMHQTQSLTEEEYQHAFRQFYPDYVIALIYMNLDNGSFEEAEILAANALNQGIITQEDCADIKKDYEEKFYPRSVARLYAACAA